MINTKCPYCGSSDMTVDMDIRITGDLQEDGTIIIRPYWTPDDELKEAMYSNSSEFMEGFCGSCGAYCNFSWEKGFIEGGGIDGLSQ